MLHKHPPRQLELPDRFWSRSVLTCVICLLVIRSGMTLPVNRIQAQEPVPAAAKGLEPLGQFVTVGAEWPVDYNVFTREKTGNGRFPGPWDAEIGRDSSPARVQTAAE